MTRAALCVLTVLSLVPFAGCRRRAHAPAASQAAGPPAGTHYEYWPGLGRIVVPNPPKNPQAYQDDQDSRQRFHMATVYVDGVPRVAFTYNEMPPGVKVSRYEYEKGYFAYHILICDYFKAIGVPCDQVKETHWYGGRDRVVVISGKDLQKYRNKFYFNFSRGLFGKPRVEWRDGVHVNDTVDMITDLAIYIHKKPPRWDRQQWSLVDDKGQPITDRIPYAKAELNRRAVRINLDGRLVAQLKRNLLEGNLTPVNAGKDEEPRYKLIDFLNLNHIPVKSFRGVDLVTQEERVIRLDRAQWESGLEFSAPRHNHGEIQVYVAGRALPASVINLYERLTPPERPMRTITLGPVARRAGAVPPGRSRKNLGFSRPAGP